MTPGPIETPAAPLDVGGIGVTDNSVQGGAVPAMRAELRTLRLQWRFENSRRNSRTAGVALNVRFRTEQRVRAELRGGSSRLCAG